MDTSRGGRQGSVCRLATTLLALLLVTVAGLLAARAEADNASRRLDLGIIVMPTQQDARLVLKQLQDGRDFAVLAKEKSIDASALDGGYLGNMEINELRPELQDALRGRKAGELTSVVHLPSGYAILKVLPFAPTVKDLNPKRISSLLATGAIHFGAQVSGLNEADAALRDFHKPDNWNNSLQETCSLRSESLATAKKLVRSYLASGRLGNTVQDQIQAHSLLAQLYDYSGEMDESTNQWEAAYQLAKIDETGYLPNLEESLGASYLHKSEMENDVYDSSSEMDIFPPLHPHAKYKQTQDSLRALHYFQEYLKLEPNDLEVKWLINLTYMTLGEYPSGVPQEDLIPEKDFTSKENVGRFRDMAPAAGLSVLRGAGGVIVDDFENDGLLDVVISSLDVCDPIRFFHNNGDGTFTDRTKEAGLLNQLGGLNLVQADYNNDGCLDILVLRGGWEYPQRKSLLRNNCDGTFTDVTAASGLGATVTQTQAAAWADIDNDGLLDLFIANENSPSQLFHNDGDGTFTEIGHAAGIDRTAFSKGVAAADYDGDGFMDFYVTNQNGVNFLYHNNGNNTFTEVAKEAGVQQPAYSFATWFFDYDNDGWPDLFVSGYLSSIDESLKTYVGGKHNGEALKLYRNNHDGTFKDVTAQVGLDKIFMPMGGNFGDIDNDGYLDIYLGTGQPSFTALLPNVLLKNNEGKSFVDVTQSSGTGELHKGHAVVFADLRRQGTEDILAETGGAVPADRHVLRVFENPGSKNDWLNVRLVGVKSNREALGAQIHVTVQDGNSPSRSIYRAVGQTSSFGANPMEQNIGLGPDAHAMSLDIRWPASKTEQHFAGVGKDQYIEIKEFAKSYTLLNRPPLRLGKKTSQMKASIAPSTNSPAANH